MALSIHPALGQLEAGAGAALGGVAAVEAQRLVVGGLGVGVLAELEVGVTEQEVGLDPAAGPGRLARARHGLAVVLLLEGDVGQTDERLAALAPAGEQALEDLAGLLVAL